MSQSFFSSWASPGRPTPANRAGRFMVMTGVVSGLLLAIQLIGLITIPPEQALAEIAKDAPAELPVGVRGITWVLAGLAVLMSGLLVAAVCTVVAGVRLRLERRDGLQLGAISTGVLGSAFILFGVLALLAAVVAPGYLAGALLMCGPAALLGWQASLLTKAWHTIPRTSMTEAIPRAVFFVRPRPGELPPP